MLTLLHLRRMYASMIFRLFLFIWMKCIFQGPYKLRVPRVSFGVPLSVFTYRVLGKTKQYYWWRLFLFVESLAQAIKISHYILISFLCFLGGSLHPVPRVRRDTKRASKKKYVKVIEICHIYKE